MRNGKQLYRNPENARIAGVCSGVAEYFGLETWLVRILVVTGFFLLAGPFIFVAYILQVYNNEYLFFLSLSYFPVITHSRNDLAIGND